MLFICPQYRINPLIIRSTLVLMKLSISRSKAKKPIIHHFIVFLNRLTILLRLKSYFLGLVAKKLRIAIIKTINKRFTQK